MRNEYEPLQIQCYCSFHEDKTKTSLSIHWKLIKLKKFKTDGSTRFIIMLVNTVNIRCIML